MDQAAGDEYLPVETEEFWMREPFAGFGSSELRVWEGEPYLFHFTGLEIGGDLVDLGAQEGGVGNIVLQAFFSADIDTVALEVHAEKITLRVHFCQPDGVFAFAAGEFQGEGVIVAEESAPLAGHAFGILKDVGERFDRFEADEFFLAHEVQS